MPTRWDQSQGDISIRLFPLDWWWASTFSRGIARVHCFPGPGGDLWGGGAVCHCVWQGRLQWCRWICQQRLWRKFTWPLQHAGGADLRSGHDGNFFDRHPWCNVQKSGRWFRRVGDRPVSHFDPFGVNSRLKHLGQPGSKHWPRPLCTNRCHRRFVAILGRPKFLVPFWEPSFSTPCLPMTDADLRHVHSVIGVTPLNVGIIAGAKGAASGSCWPFPIGKLPSHLSFGQ